MLTSRTARVIGRIAGTVVAATAPAFPAGRSPAADDPACPQSPAPVKTMNLTCRACP